MATARGKGKRKWSWGLRGGKAGPLGSAPRALRVPPPPGGVVSERDMTDNAASPITPKSTCQFARSASGTAFSY